MNVKEEFIKWFFENANGRYGSLNLYTVSQDLEESNKRLDKNIFEVDKANYEDILDYLQKELYRKGTEFDIYSEGVSNHRPRAILGKENFFKFLKQKFGSNNQKEESYWIFQGNSDIYDIEKSLKAGHLKSWKVSAHKYKIQSGDKVILWKTGENPGCYALAEVISDVGIVVEEKHNLGKRK